MCLMHTVQRRMENDTVMDGDVVSIWLVTEGTEEYHAKPQAWLEWSRDSSRGTSECETGLLSLQEVAPACCNKITVIIQCFGVTELRVFHLIFSWNSPYVLSLISVITQMRARSVVFHLFRDCKDSYPITGSLPRAAPVFHSTPSSEHRLTVLFKLTLRYPQWVEVGSRALGSTKHQHNEAQMHCSSRMTGYQASVDLGYIIRPCHSSGG